ncbi:hypothetical protein ACIBKY_32825 [Nonomuraea sp. NPDC050394]|uniref:hypothetical protein n=1 Tax=Nonomuraea sp. NPDC050394 TaxID=3364363 RepID=UPI0037B56D14
MTLQFDSEWITSDSCKQVAKAEPRGRWVLSWRPGSYSRDQAIAALTRAESGDLATDPEQPLPRADAPTSGSISTKEQQEPDGGPQ